jgi:drug/metabolite transporter (DMT)-like permease
MIFASSIMYATYGVWSRLMGNVFPPFYQAWVRSLVIVVMMLPWMLARRKFRKFDRADLPRLGLYLVFSAFTQVPIYFAFNHAPIGTVQLVFYSTFSVTAYLVGWKALGETMTKVKVLAAGLALVGLLTVFGLSALAFAPMGIALAALNGFASGGETVGSKKITDKYSPALLVFWGWVFTLFTHLPISYLLGEHEYYEPHLNAPWLAMFAYAFVSAGAFWLAIAGFRYVDASVGSLVGTAEVVFSVVYGALFFHQPLTWTVAGGGVVVLAAATLPDVVEVRGIRTATHSVLEASTDQEVAEEGSAGRSEELVKVGADAVPESQHHRGEIGDPASVMAAQQFPETYQRKSVIGRIGPEPGYGLTPGIAVGSSLSENL